MQNNRLGRKENRFSVFSRLLDAKEVFQTEPPDLMHKRTRCTRIRTRTHMDALRRNTSRQRNNYIGGNPLMYPEISASISVSLPNLMQKQEHETDDFLILKKRKRTKKEKREKIN